ncbi:MAG: HD domain-containing protein [Planctomycetota bacterium]
MLERLLTLLTLDALPRTGWLQAGLRDVESIAAHSHGVTLLALVLGEQVEPDLDLDRCVALCAVHDVPEALLGDFPRHASQLLPEGAKATAETRAAELLLGGPEGAARQRFDEYARGETREARFARVCDKLHLGLRGFGYARAGHRNLDTFRTSLERLDCAEFPTAVALQQAILGAWARL